MAKKKNETVNPDDERTAKIVPLSETDEASERVTQEADAESKHVIGIVTNCLKLNIRKEPKADAVILTEVAVLSELMIDPVRSTDEWLSVCTPPGVEGFCMKRFIAVRP